MSKRAHSVEPHTSHTNKKSRPATNNHYNKIASFENAAAVDNDPPLPKLLDTMKKQSKPSKDGDAVVYWMRMQDIRIDDNRALSKASSQAQSLSVPLIVMFAISPQDYAAHDRGARRIDFMLRNLSLLKNTLNELHIPLYTFTHKPRKTLPSKVVSTLESWGAKYLYGNIEYEVDELRRDIQTCEEASEKGIQCTFMHDKPMVEPNTLKTQAGKPYAVYSPWLRGWIQHLNNHLSLIEQSPKPKPNDKSTRDKKLFSELFDSEVPENVPGFECADRDRMKEYWPEGYQAARTRLEKFLKGKNETNKKSGKDGMIHSYDEVRDRADMDGTSGLSPYLASGVISSRECVRETMALSKAKKVEASRGNGPGTWIQELAWRDFYIHVLVAFPRVSMGRPFSEKFADVKWEVNEEHLQAWKDGKTGVPIVDAGMRQIKEMGWIHNRCRMVVAMYLTKDLMLDWRLGEKYFMENLLDGDLASNNGGWQWSASTGTDPQPYFRIFNPASQSQKADPTGDYIRKYVPELAKLKGKSLYEPPPESADAHGYPRALVDHKASRERALRRYKNPGEE